MCGYVNVQMDGSINEWKLREKRQKNAMAWRDADRNNGRTVDLVG